VQVVADCLGVRCQLRRGLALTGAEEEGQAVVAWGGGEYVVDLVEVPGRLLPTTEGQRMVWPTSAPPAAGGWWLCMCVREEGGGCEWSNGRCTRSGCFVGGSAGMGRIQAAGTAMLGHVA
jgi:hypothetical protein